MNVLRWHEPVRSAVTGDALHFFRFSVSAFETDQLAHDLDQAVRAADAPLRGYELHETLGSWDYLFVCWLPHGYSADMMEDFLLDSLSRYEVDNVQHFGVRDVLAHHSWQRSGSVSSDSIRTDDIDLAGIDSYNEESLRFNSQGLL